MERQFDFAWLERANGRRGDNIFGEDMGVAIAVAAGWFFWFGRLDVGAFGSFGLSLLLWFGFSAIGRDALDGQLRLVRIVFAFRCHVRFLFQKEFSIKQATARTVQTA